MSKNPFPKLVVAIVFLAVASVLYYVSNNSDKEKAANTTKTAPATTQGSVCKTNANIKMGFVKSPDKKVMKSFNSGENQTIEISIENFSDFELFTTRSPKNNFVIGGSWTDEKGQKLYEHPYVNIDPALKPTEKRDFEVSIKAPEKKGKYKLLVAVLNIGCDWHVPGFGTPEEAQTEQYISYTIDLK